MYKKNFPHKRFKITIDFLRKHISTKESILDLGVANPLSKLMKSSGYKVQNTLGEDLDTNLETIINTKTEVVTAFQIFEHMLNPFQLLNEIKTDKLICSVPLKLWFANAYRNHQDIRDNHYHEFETWQFKMLLKKTGWNVVAEEKFTNPVLKIGVRPILRMFTPRYLLIYAEKKSFK